MAELLEHLAGNGYEGQLVLEVSTRKSPDRQTRMRELAEALAFTRLHFAGPKEPEPALGRRERIAMLRDRPQPPPRRFSVDPGGSVDDEGDADRDRP